MNTVTLSRIIQNIPSRKTPIAVCLASLFLVPFAVAENTDESIESSVVTGTVLSRYDYDEASSATGFNIDTDEVPRTVQVLPEQLILDQGADNIVDVLTNAAGVTRAHGFGGAENQVNIRGFVNNRTFVDGSPVSVSYNLDVSTIDRAEVVLGPASILNGQVSPGGLINIITKAPQIESANTIQVEVDQHGKQKLFLDSTGSLTDKLQYRVIFSGEDSENNRVVKTTAGSFHDETESYSISPSISYTPNDRNTFTLRLNYTDKKQPIDRGTVAVLGDDGNISVADISRDRRLGSEFDRRDSQSFRGQLNWDSILDDNYNWTNKFTVSYFQQDYDDYQARPILGFDGANFANNVLTNGLLLRQFDSNLDVKESEISISDSIVGDYELSGFSNKIIIAANYNRRTIENGDGLALAAQGGSIFSTDFDIIDIYSDTQDANVKKDQSLLSDNDENYEEFGFSIQNIVEVTDRLNILAGLRYDHFKSDVKTNLYFESIAVGAYNQLTTAEKGQTKSSNDNISGQAGALFKVNENVSAYASYAESFTPNYVSATAGTVSSDVNFDPEEASQIEIGLKTNFLNDKLRFSVAAYELTRENVIKFNNLTASLNGEERTKGVDISSNMQFLPGLNVLATYSYLDSKIIDDNGDGNEGNTPFSVPDNKARAWGSYEVQAGGLSGLGFGLGAEYVDSRYGDDANTFKLPSYTTFDTALWMYFKVSPDTKLRLQGGIKNFTDKTYYPANGSGSTYRINVGEPRTLYASARLDF